MNLQSACESEEEASDTANRPVALVLLISCCVFNLVFASNMSIFDRVNANVLTARANTTHRNISASHSRSQSGHHGLQALADAAQMTPQRRNQSVSPSRYVL